MPPWERVVFRHPWLFLVLFTVPVLYVPVLRLPLLLLCGLGAFVFLVSARRHVPHRWLAGGGFAACLLIAVWSAVDREPPEPQWPCPVAEIRSGSGVVVMEAAQTRSGESPFQLELDRVDGPQGSVAVKIRLVVRGHRNTSPACGSRVEWVGRCSGDRLLVHSLTEVGYVAPWWEARAAVRVAFHRAYHGWEAPAAGLAEALVLGSVDDLTVAEKRSFRNAGCSHVLALSGMHLSLLALAVGLGLRRWVDPWLAVVVTQTLIALFCFLAGPIPSLYRAWVMAAVVDLSRLSRVRWSPLELLSASFLVTVVLWPPMTETLSLQLSFLALAGLVLWSRWWEWRLRPYLGRWGASALAPGLAAWMSTVVLSAAVFGEARWVGILVSAPLVVLTNIYLGLSVMALLVAPVCDPGFLSGLMSGLYQAIFLMTGWAGRAPALTGGTLWAVLGFVALGTFAGILYNMGPRGPTLPVSLNYDSPKDLQAFLDDRGFNALKRWGQNFLINPGARKQILDGLDLRPGEPVWEIGPGLGALTHHLVAQGHPTTVFEIDPGYSVFLRDEFGAAPAGFQLYEGDVIKTWRSAVPGAGMAQVKCVGNLPYNAASAIIADFIEGGYFPSVFVVTVQKEMADRMTASVGTKNYSSFSVLCQSAFRLTDVVVLKPGSFYPAPEVTSRVVKLVPHGLHPGLDHRRFSTFVRECFSSRRKTLRNNVPGVAAALRVSEDALRSGFVSQGVDLGRRAETLSVEEFLRVYATTDRASTSPL